MIGMTKKDELKRLERNIEDEVDIVSRMNEYAKIGGYDGGKAEWKIGVRGKETYEDA